MIRKFLFAFTIFLLLFTSPLLAADVNYYLDSNDPSGDGSLGDPWANFDDIDWSAVATQIGLGNPVYINLKRGETWASQQFVFEASGTSDSVRVALTSYGVGNKPIIDRNNDSGSEIGVGISTLDSDGTTYHDYLTIDDIKVIDAWIGVRINGTDNLAGDYSDYVTVTRMVLDGKPDTEQHSMRNGISARGDHIVIGGAPGMGNEVVDCNSTRNPTGGADIIFGVTKNIEISYNEFHGSTNNPVSYYWGTVYDHGIDGITASGGHGTVQTNAVIHHNKTHTHRFEGGVPGQEDEKGEDGMDFKTQQHPNGSFTVYANDAYNNRQRGIQFQNTRNVEIYGNRAWNNSTGILVNTGECINSPNCIKYDAEDIKIYSNLVFLNEYSGIKVVEGGSCPNCDTETVDIHNNTVVRNGNAGDADNNDFGISVTGGVRDVCIRNNAVYDNQVNINGTREQIAVWDEASLRSVACLDGNIYWASNTGSYNVQMQLVSSDITIPVLQALPAGGPPYYEATGLVDNPDFTDSEATPPDLTLTSFSPAIDTGTNLGDDYKLALDSANTDWTTTPPTVTLVDQNLYGSGWEKGSYVTGVAIYYVDADAANDEDDGLCQTDQNPGTPSCGPWKTVTKVNTEWASGTFAPGDFIKFQSGDTWSGNPGVKIDVTESGIANAPITITSYGAGARPIIQKETDTGINWKNRSTAEKEVVGLNGHDYITIDGLHLKNSYRGIGADNSDNIVVINSEIEGVCKSAIGTTDLTNLTFGGLGNGNIVHTTFYEESLPCGTPSSHPDQQLINIGSRSHDWYVGYNEIYLDDGGHSLSAAIEIAAGYDNLANFAYNIMIEHNYVHDFIGTGDDAIGYNAKGGRDVTVRYNLFRNVQRRPIYPNNNSYNHWIYGNRVDFVGGTSHANGFLAREDNQGGVDGQYNIFVWANIIMDTNDNCISVSELYDGDGDGTQKFYFWNNTLVNCGTEATNDYAMSEGAPPGYSLRFANNIVYDSANGLNAASFNSNTTYRTVQNNVWYDPDGSLLVNYGGSNLVPGPGGHNFANTSTANPNLDANYKLQANSTNSIHQGIDIKTDWSIPNSWDGSNHADYQLDPVNTDWTLTGGSPNLPTKVVAIDNNTKDRGAYASAVGPIYALREDGSVVDGKKSEASSCSAASTAMNVADHNATTFLPGDTITLCDEGGPIDSEIRMVSSGSDTAQITYDGMPEGDCDPRWTTCTGAAKISPDYNAGNAICLLHQSYITFQDFEVTDTDHFSEGFSNCSGSGDSYDLRFYRLYIHEFQIRGILVGNTRNLVVGGSDENGNHFYNCGEKQTDSGIPVPGAIDGSAGACVAIGGNNVDFTISHNVMHGNGTNRGKDGVVLASNSSYNGVIEYNTIYDQNDFTFADGDGIDLKSSHDIILRYNNIYNTQDAGIRIQDGAYNIEAYGNRLWNNNEVAFSINSRLGLDTKNVTLSGNIIYDSGGSCIAMKEDGSTGSYSEDIYIYNNTIAYCGQNDPSYNYTACVAGTVKNGELKIYDNIFYQCRASHNSYKGMSVKIFETGMLDDSDNNVYYYSGGDAHLAIGFNPSTGTEYYTIGPSNPTTGRACYDLGFECDSIDEDNPNFEDPGQILSSNWRLTSSSTAALNNSSTTRSILDPSTNWIVIPPDVKGKVSNEIGAYSEPSTKTTQSGSSSFR
jgi:hypothetical protein